jgi:hypothetical protein
MKYKVDDLWANRIRTRHVTTETTQHYDWQSYTLKIFWAGVVNLFIILAADARYEYKQVGVTERTVEAPRLKMQRCG